MVLPKSSWELATTLILVTSHLSSGLPFVQPASGDDQWLQLGTVRTSRAFQGPCAYTDSYFIVIFTSWLGNKTEGRGQAHEEHPCQGRSCPSRAALLVV